VVCSGVLRSAAVNRKRPLSRTLARCGWSARCAD
jgi:hypothetical protein